MNFARFTVAYTAFTFLALATVGMVDARADTAPAACDASTTLADVLVAHDGFTSYHYAGADALKLIKGLETAYPGDNPDADLSVDVVVATDGVNAVFLLFDKDGCLATYAGPVTDAEAADDLTAAGFKAPFGGGLPA